MKLQDLLAETGDVALNRDEEGCIHVFMSAKNERLDRRYWRLEDYTVSSTASGPSIYLVPGPSISERYR